MSGPGAGFEYPRAEVSWLKRDVLLFANSIGCTVDELHFLYARISFKLFMIVLLTFVGTASRLRCLPYIPNHPSYAITHSPLISTPRLHDIAFKHTTQEVIDFYAKQSETPIPGIPKLDMTRGLDGQRLMTFLKPLPPTSAGKKFEIRSKVIGVYDKGKAGTVIETQQDLVDAATGEAYTRAIGSAFFVGQGNWGGPKGPPTVNFPPPADKKPDAVIEHQLTLESALLYR